LEELRLKTDFFKKRLKYFKEKKRENIEEIGGIKKICYNLS